MTVTEPEFKALQRELMADLTTLRELDDIVALLRCSASGDGAGVVWHFGQSRELEGPGLVFGLNGTVGFVQWYDEDIMLIPKGIRYTGGYVFYATATGPDFGVDPGEEIPVEYAYAAALEYAATGERPRCIPWTTPPPEPPHIPTAKEQEIYAIMAKINAELAPTTEADSPQPGTGAASNPPR